MKIFRYVLFTILADFSVVACLAIAALVMYYINKLPIWGSFLVILLLGKSLAGILTLVPVFVSKLSPSYKYSFWAFLVLTILHTIQYGFLVFEKFEKTSNRLGTIALALIVAYNLIYGTYMYKISFAENKNLS